PATLLRIGARIDFAAWRATTAPACAINSSISYLTAGHPHRWRGLVRRSHRTPGRDSVRPEPAAFVLWIRGSLVFPAIPLRRDTARLRRQDRKHTDQRNARTDRQGWKDLAGSLDRCRGRYVLYELSRPRHRGAALALGCCDRARRLAELESHA